MAALRDQYRQGKTQLLDGLASTGSSTRGIHSTLRKLAAHADSLLRTLWQQAGLPSEAALVAVGGHGRGELFPHSCLSSG